MRVRAAWGKSLTMRPELIGSSRTTCSGMANPLTRRRTPFCGTSAVQVEGDEKRPVVILALASAKWEAGCLDSQIKYWALKTIGEKAGIALLRVSKALFPLFVPRDGRA
jgi:hypothetical protein